MASSMRHKRSAVAGKVPAVGDLSLGELAINTTDGKLYLKKSVGGVESVVLIGGGAAEQGFFQRYDYTATAGQTVFIADYLPGALVVLHNGRALQPANYTATNGSSVTIPTATTGDSVTIIAFSTFEVANTYTKTEVDALLSAAGAPILTKQFISAEQSITVGGALTLSHGLGVKPKLVTGALICKVAEAGYAVGDEINDALTYSYTDAGVPVTNTVSCDTTSIFLRFQSAVGLYRVLHKTTGALTNITPSSWRFIVRAFA